MSELYDLIIIGAAAAGCSASIYASRRQLKYAVITKDIGGEVALSGEVENWPGIIHTTGIQLANDFEKHMKSYNPEIALGFGVEKIEQDGNTHIVYAKSFSGEEKIYRTKTVIIATGIHPRELNIPGEKKLNGRGVTYCTVCDGPLYKNKITTTIGAGNAALESALMLSKISSKAYLVTKYKDSKETNGGFPRGENILIEKVKKEKNIEIIYNAITTEITGDNVVQGITYKNQETGEETTVKTNGVMVHIGVIPNSSFVEKIEKDKIGQIKVNTRCETNIKGVFAAGDVTDNQYNQIVIAAGQGVTAALSAIEDINRWSE
ncbi:MAG: FAD-dependent oxidoreductase [Candidatus Magasanikbacteria bacterium]|nr:FAD-dependent oxidoreductase [Candidatus Magasanikbacteria bacterium]NCS71981.1 FAD-dependent oxidoreductase [Candidatus Magasanikbacteria bacterium]